MKFVIPSTPILFHMDFGDYRVLTTLSFFDVGHARLTTPHDLQARADQVKCLQLLTLNVAASFHVVRCSILVLTAEVDILTAAIGRDCGSHATMSACSCLGLLRDSGSGSSVEFTEQQ